MHSDGILSGSDVHGLVLFPISGNYTILALAFFFSLILRLRDTNKCYGSVSMCERVRDCGLCKHADNDVLSYTRRDARTD